MDACMHGWWMGARIDGGMDGWMHRWRTTRICVNESGRSVGLLVVFLPESIMVNLGWSLSPSQSRQHCRMNTPFSRRGSKHPFP